MDMNRSKEILDYFASTDNPGDVIIAPNAPPISRDAQGVVQVALSIILAAKDVDDTLSTFRTLAPTTGSATLGNAGTFSFGMNEVGRFRVNYVTQRGSKIANIVRVPFTVPDPESVCDDSATIERLLEIFYSSKGGILAVSGPSAVSNSTLIYSLLKKVNRTKRMVLYILERALTFIMAHAESIVIQIELHTDVNSMEEGAQNAFLFEPDIMYVGDIRPSDELPSVTQVMELGVLTIVSSVLLNGKMLMEKFRPKSTDSQESFRQMIRGMVKVSPGKGGKLSINFSDQIPGE